MCATNLYLTVLLLLSIGEAIGGYEPDLGLSPEDLDLTPKDHTVHKSADKEDKPATSFQSFYLESKDPVPFKVSKGKGKTIEHPKSPITFKADPNGEYKEHIVDIENTHEEENIFGGFSGTGQPLSQAHNSQQSSLQHSHGNNEHAHRAAAQDFTVVHDVPRNHNGYGNHRPQPSFVHDETVGQGNHVLEGNQVGHSASPPHTGQFSDQHQHHQGYSQGYTGQSQDYQQYNQNSENFQGSLDGYHPQGQNADISSYGQQEPDESQIEYIGEGFTYEIHDVPRGQNHHQHHEHHHHH